MANFKGNLRKFKTHQEFLDYSKVFHNDKFEYLSKYLGIKQNLLIRCKKCGNIFEQIAGDHFRKNKDKISKGGCKKCHYESVSLLNKDTDEKFLSKLKNIHGDKYTPIDKYIKANIKIHVLCNICKNIFYLTPNKIFMRGCNICGKLSMGKSRIVGIEKFKEKAIKVHGIGRYEYPDTYENCKIKMSIKCLQCNSTWMTTPDTHLRGSGCPICCESKGEREIKNYLEKYTISYTRQKTFTGCEDKKLLKFDFYLIDLHTLIEYQGEQHYTPVVFGGMNLLEATERFKINKYHDYLKRKFCKKNEILLISISYKKIKKIETILNKKLTNDLKVTTL